MSFRSRSARGSLKSNSNVNIHKTQEADPPKAEVRRQRTLLSQTSWRSMPIIPNLVRQFSSKSSSNSHHRQEPPPVSGSPETNCGMCGFWKPRASSAEIEQSIPQHNRIHSLDHEIKEEDEDEDIPLPEEMCSLHIQAKEDSDAEDGV
ncbi:uncharacterized protein TNCV_3975031 [Trichonephila clavipes]|nr:uncharacterized protein TNCV_3975031 [Trichonephila clavipes]